MSNEKKSLKDIRTFLQSEKDNIASYSLYTNVNLIEKESRYNR